METLIGADWGATSGTVQIVASDAVTSCSTQVADLFPVLAVRRDPTPSERKAFLQALHKRVQTREARR